MIPSRLFEEALLEYQNEISQECKTVDRSYVENWLTDNFKSIVNEESMNRLCHTFVAKNRCTTCVKVLHSLKEFKKLPLFDFINKMSQLIDSFDESYFQNEKGIFFFNLMINAFMVKNGFPPIVFHKKDINTLFVDTISLQEKLEFLHNKVTEKIYLGHEGVAHRIEILIDGAFYQIPRSGDRIKIEWQPMRFLTRHR